jgi:hypothetical protein
MQNSQHQTTEKNVKTQSVTITFGSIAVAAVNGIIGGLASYFVKPIVDKYLNKKYVKIIAKYNGWFDEGTQVYDSNIQPYKKLVRFKAKEFDESWKPSGHILGRGFRKGQLDEELCPLEEFDISYTKEM